MLERVLDLDLIRPEAPRRIARSEYDRMVEEFDRRLYEAIESGQDPGRFPHAFALSDVPEVAPGQSRRAAAAPNGRTHGFRMSDISEAQQGAARRDGEPAPEWVLAIVGVGAVLAGLAVRRRASRRERA